MRKVNELVSIIIPVYNVGKYIGRCIESVIKQDYREIEIILIEDGSTDNSLEICEEYESKNDNIKLLTQKNSGVSVARNKGIELSHGKWICFVDGDDYIEHNFISELVNAYKEKECDVIITPPIFEYSKESKFGRIFEDEIVFDDSNRERLELNIICRQFGNNYNTDIGAGGPWGKLYKSDFLKKNNFIFLPGLRRMQDVVFNLNVLSQASVVWYKQIYGYHYRINNNSVCIKYNPQIYDIFFEVINEMKKFIDEKNKSTDYYQALYLKIILLYIEGARISIMHKDNNCNIVEKIRQLKKVFEQKVITEAFKNINSKYLNAKMKIFVTAAKMKQFMLIYFMIILFMKSKLKEQN